MLFKKKSRNCSPIVPQKSWQFLVNFNFHTAYFFMMEYCSWCQNNEIKQCCYVGTLENLEIWALVSIRENIISWRKFFRNMSFSIFLEVANSKPHFWSSAILAWLCLAIRGNFFALKKQNIMTSFWWCYKNHFLTKKSQKSILCTTLQAIIWAFGLSPNLARRCLIPVVMELGVQNF